MRIARWLLGNGPENAGVVLGNDAAGKTTLLYQLKLGEQVCAIPTIGFNVETIEYADGGKITLWDVGGCDKIRPLIRHYITPDKFILFVHDCTDPDRLDYSLEQLHAGAQWMVDEGCRYMWVLFNKQDLLPPGERDSIVNDLRARFESELSPYKHSFCAKVMDTPGLSAATGEQLDEAMRDIRETLQKIPKRPAQKKQDEVAKAEQGPSEQELVERIKTFNAESLGPGEFWRAFVKGELEAWDHYSHLRAGYFVMFEGMSRRASLLECAGHFLDYLATLREKNPERFRNTAHRTMTIFWLYQIQLAAVAYQADKNLAEFPSRADFGDILLLTPSLMNSGLWTAYYSKELLFSPEARASWHLPDLQPLPSFQPRAMALKQDAAQVQDDGYRLPRFAFAVVQKTLSSKLRRGGVVKQALQALQMSTIRLRAANPLVPPYSETQAYFWIQFIHSLLKSLEISTASPSSGSPSSSFDVPGSVLTFEAFVALFDVSGAEWTTHYTPKTWESVPARMAFVNPDKKPLPNFFASPSPAKMELARVRMVNAATHRFVAPPELPPRDELEFAAAVLIDEAGLEGSLSLVSHAGLLQHLYRRLAAEEAGVSGAAAVEVALELAKTLGMTQSMFWVQQVQIAMAGAVGVSSFEAFVTKSAHLAYEDLPLLYYSPELWESSEARDMFVPCDRRALSSIVKA